MTSSLTPARHLCWLAHCKGRAERLQGHLHSPQGLESLLSDPLQIKAANTCLERLSDFTVCVLSIGVGGGVDSGEAGESLHILGLGWSLGFCILISHSC